MTVRLENSLKTIKHKTKMKETEHIIKKIVKKEHLPLIRERHKDKKIVFCTGCFDVLHAGHSVFIQQCKSFGDVLVVGIGSDSIIQKLKGPGRPVNSEMNRAFLIASLNNVDYVVINDEEMQEGKIDFKTAIENLCPDVFVLNDDDSVINLKKKFLDKHGVKLELVKRETPSELNPISSSEIIHKRSKNKNAAPLGKFIEDHK